MKKIAALYLCRYGNPPEAAQRFLQSLMRHRAGADFELIYVLKGFPENRTDDVLNKFRNRLPCSVSEVRVSDEFFMINALLDAAAQVPHEMIFPLSSWSVVLARNWLGACVGALRDVPGCMASGASGNYNGGHIGNIFPNVHLRTTAFLIERKTFLSLDRGLLRTKLDNNLFESGLNGMTRQIMARGGTVAVAGRKGPYWMPDTWPQSHTYCSGHQENLLVADNRTQMYGEGNYKDRLRLAKESWEDEKLAAPLSLVEHLQRFWRRAPTKLKLHLNKHFHREPTPSNS